MLKIVRELAVENPWVLRIIIGLIAVAFIITMGWFGFEAPTSNRAALVNGTEVSLKEYRGAYNRAVEFYRQTYKDQFNDEFLRKLNLEDKVLNDLIERTLWIQEAKAMGLEVTDQELSAAVTEIPDFQKDGKFDPDLYRRVLEANRTKPEAFEGSFRNSLRVEKARRIVRDAVAVTDREVAESYPTAAPKGGASPSPEEKERLRQFLLFQKQEKALKAYADEMRKKAKVKINDEVL